MPTIHITDITTQRVAADATGPPASYREACRARIPVVFAHAERFGHDDDKAVR